MALPALDVVAKITPLRGQKVFEHAVALLEGVIRRQPNGDRLLETLPSLTASYARVVRPGVTPQQWVDFTQYLLTWRYMVHALYAGAQDELVELICVRPTTAAMTGGHILAFCWLFGLVDGADPEAPPTVAFVPYPMQIEVIARAIWLMLEPPDKGHDLAILKGRQTGITSVFLHIYTYLWKTTTWRLGLGSYRADEVDKNPRSANPHSLMGRIERLILAQPDGYFEDEKLSLASSALRQMMQWLHYDNRSRLDGEAASVHFTRSRTYDDMLVDEWAAWPEPMTILAASHPNIILLRVMLTTPGEGLTDLDDYYNRLKADTPYRYMEINWWDRLERDDAWERAAKTELGDAHFAIEHGLSFQPADEEVVYPTYRGVATQTTRFEIERDNPLVLGIDFGRRDGTAIIVGQLDRWGWFNILMDHYSVFNTIDFYIPFLGGTLWQTGGAYTPEDHEWVQQLQAAIRMAGGILRFGDPAGQHVTALKDDSVLRVLARAGVPVWTTSGPVTHAERQSQTRDLIKRLRVNITDAPNLHQSMLRYRYPRRRVSATPPKATPVHDRWSHAVTALEFIAVHREQWASQGRRPTQALKRQERGWAALR